MDAQDLEDPASSLLDVVIFNLRIELGHLRFLHLLLSILQPPRNLLFGLLSGSLTSLQPAFELIHGGRKQVYIGAVDTHVMEAGP